ncbi:G5 domain-containing protein [Candidatus Saccharibacteria bacterium]|nr:G5 domain-containing protein [Candidatus Saccharibacteria bacterium]
MGSLSKYIKSISGIFIGVASFFTVLGSNVEPAKITTEIERVPEPIYYEAETIYDNTLREGTKEVRQEGKNGEKLISYEITSKNNKEIKREYSSEEVLTEPVSKIVIIGTKKFYTCSNGTEYESLEEKDDCEKRIEWEKVKNSELEKCNNDSSKTNCWYDEYPGTTIHYTIYIAPVTYVAPTTPQSTSASTYNNGARTGAICKDGWHSTATGRGACSHHGGVLYWLY